MLMRRWERARQGERRLRLDIGCRVFKGIDEREERHVSGSPAVQGSMANLALGIAPLPERQASRRQFIFGPAIGTFEDHHHAFTMRPLSGPRLASRRINYRGSF
jgi:hypothetical protein